MSINEYNQRNGEQREDWKKRVLTAIAREETDLDWIDACFLLGLPANKEEFDRTMDKYLSEEMVHKELKEAVKETDEYDALEEKRQELAREEVRMRDQRRMLQNNVRKMARSEHIFDEILKACRETAGTITFDPSEFKGDQNKSNDNNEGVLLLSDWHVGQNSANSWNLYNDVVFEKRIGKLMHDTILYGQENKIRKLHVFVLGDLINGLIHVTTRIENDENVVKQVVRASEMLAKMLESFSHFFDVNVYFARGNHDRVSAKKQENLDDESFFDIIPWYLKARIDKDHKTLHIIDNEFDPEIIRVEVAGHICYGIHGHKDKPSQVAKKLPTFMKEMPEYIFMGHFHSSAELDENGIEVIVNSSLCGTDSFAVSLRKNSKASQKFMIFDETGRICTYNLQLGDVSKK